MISHAQENAVSYSALSPLEQALHRYFGFHTFRPVQREIVETMLANRDVLALLPTGGGKSLCYQLPALMREGLTLVISPLIALMKDQVDSLVEMDIPATFLNSSLDSEESRARWRDLHRGKYKILYLAPERLMTDGMLDAIESWNPSLVAVDEAHCISEWGHDFRPEYRRLANFRERFPQVPIAAFTATATGRVKADIESLLQLRDPQVFVASFNRPNLRYKLYPRAKPVDQIVAVAQAHQGESGIVYCSSRNRTETVATQLAANGITAVAYHAGLESFERARRQDLFIKDEVQVVVATVAFGMGVDKPDVRFVIHHDLPKNMEGYYQETGRACRDGLPGECILLYNPGDAARIRHFISEMQDGAEQEVARGHLKTLVDYCESSECRRVVLLRYFGETLQDAEGQPVTNCGACDNCLSPRGEVDQTRYAQMLLSCVLRIHQKSGFYVGLQHVVDVLIGSTAEKVLKWGHERLSTYGIGKDFPRSGWVHLGRELIRLGMLELHEDRFNVVTVSEAGRGVVRGNSSVSVHAPVLPFKPDKKKSASNIAGSSSVAADLAPVESALLSRLKDWRRAMAGARKVPAYVIFHDSTLLAIARDQPKTIRALGSIPGLGEKKLAQYGEELLALV